MPKLRRKFTIANEIGIHARPASMLVHCLLQFKSDVHVEKDGRRVNGKSIMGVLMLAASQGSRILVEADGQDAQEALDAVEKLILDRFGEDRR
jgi:phosphocarrier protein HPr